MKNDVPKDKVNNLTSSERKTLFVFKNDKNIVIKGTDSELAVVVWDREDWC